MIFRRLIASLLLFTFLAQACDRLMIIAGFYANQSYIAQNLCENRSRPNMRCCGKCVLRKKLAQQENGNKESPEKKSETNVEVLSSRSFFPELSIIPNSTFTFYPEFLPGQTVDRASDFFHPPCLSGQISFA